MLTFNELSMAFGNQLLFCDVNLILNPGQRYAVVGANGSGKSTLFKLITGEEEVGLGNLLIPKEATIGWLKQDQFRYEHTPILDVVLQGKPALWAAQEERNRLLETEEWDEKTAARFSALEEIITHYDGYNAASEIATILEGLGILSRFHDKPLNTLSGGYKLRVLLAQALFSRPSILLLDEPTNHLDIVSIQWLEKFLKTNFEGLVLFISHDVDFINNIAHFILDIDYGEIRKYSGKYQKFLDEKKLIQDQKLVEKKSAEEKVARMQKYVDRFKAKASKAAQARSRMKMIEKIEIPDVLHSSRIAPNFKFIPKRPSGKLACKAEKLAKAFQQKTLFSNLNIEIHRGEKVAILGINGKGKSTLLKVLVQQIQPDEGTVTWGTETHISYFSQDHHELLNYSISVLQWLNNVSSQCTEQQVRRALGQVLFTKDEVDKDILLLSGGEAARLLLAKVMLESPNVLILDEPTNHMDIETIEALSHALHEYTGTLIAVSHNRHFIESFANKIIYFSQHHGVQQFKGTYHDFALKGMLDG
jgi:ATPase subunit of ABC transporter with duplicated ATPase domains